jgi:hypothetical protein
MPESIHRKKLFGGRATAEEVHALHAFPIDAKCGGCSKGHGSLQTRVIVLAPVSEMRKRDPMMDMLADARPQDFLKMVVQSKYGPLLRLNTAYACKACSPALEKAVAKGAPSWAVVDIHRGVGADRVQVQVAGTLVRPTLTV